MDNSWLAFRSPKVRINRRKKWPSKTGFPWRFLIERTFSHGNETLSSLISSFIMSVTFGFTSRIFHISYWRLSNFFVLLLCSISFVIYVTFPTWSIGFGYRWFHLCEFRIFYILTMVREREREINGEENMKSSQDLGKTLSILKARKKLSKRE